MTCYTRDDLKRKHPDLSTVDGSITKALNENMSAVNAAHADKLVTLDEFKALVKDIIIGADDKPLDAKTPATQRIINGVDEQKSKNNLISYYYNIMLAGMGLAAVNN